jgi:hypothetical protein
MSEDQIAQHSIHDATRVCPQGWTPPITGRFNYLQPCPRPPSGRRSRKSGGSHLQSLALKAIQTHRRGGDENLLLSVTLQMLSDAWQLLPNCPNCTLASHCEDAIDAQIGLLGPNLPQDLP